MKAVLETWRPVRGYEGLYEISDYGCVRSHYGGKIKYLKGQKNKGGYIHVGLWKNGKGKTFSVHRLVYTVFVGNIDEGLQLDHIDGDKTNNKLTNLRAVTPRENSNNSVTRDRYLEAIKKLTASEEWRNNQREGAKKRSQNQEWRQKNREVAQRNQRNPEWLKNVRDGIMRSCAKPILQLDVETGEVIRRWECARDAERGLGVSNSHISKCCLGKQKTAGGFRWRFATDDD